MKHSPKLFRFNLQDMLFSCVGSILAFLLLRWLSEPSPGFTTHLLIYLAGALVFSILGFYFSGLTKEVRSVSTSWGGRRIVWALLVKSAGQAVLLISPLTGIHTPAIILMTVLSDLILSLGLISYPRVLVAQIRREDRELRSLPDTLNTLVYGTTAESVDLARSAHKSGRHAVIGLLSRNPEENGMTLDEFAIYYAPSEESIEELQWRLGGIDCILYPKGDAHMSGNGGKTAVDDVAIPDPMSPLERMVKRSFDVLISGVLLLVFSPLMAVCAVAVYREDGKPVIYRQERMGRGGKVFSILKFRTMRTDAEKAGPALYSGDEDPRLTRTGKFLRQHHLDELPQLWNVFRGDMSFVGYRPERDYFIEKIMEANPRYRYLFQLRPGVTSYATLYNGYTDSLEKMLRRLDLDLYYLRNHSLGFDARILGLTFLNIVKGKKF